MPHLDSIELKSTVSYESDAYPFRVPAIARLGKLDLGAPIVFFVGQNGSGKSTLLEAIALAAELPVVGSSEGPRDPSLAPQRRLAKALRMSWARRVRRGFFLRAEDFFGFQRRLVREKAELMDRLAQIDVDYQDRSDLARGLAAGPVKGSIADMERRYGDDPDARSHGEAFLELFQSRFSPDSLILLDEPEAALSPQSQLGLVVMLLEMAKKRAQFIVATHSPIVLATPGARIYSFDGDGITAAGYDDLEHVRLTRDFLRDPERFLRRLEG